jgi:hypothetical protein
MRFVFMFISLIAAGHLIAQSDSSGQQPLTSVYTNVHTLKRSDIERLPFIQFMELVQHAFPFIGNESMVEEEYAFVVNGFLQINPNSINISQIESISFYPAGTLLTRGSSQKKGTFVIATRPDKNGFSLSTKTGLFIGNDDVQAGPTAVAVIKKGISSLNELSFQHTTQHWYISNAFSFLEHKPPVYQLSSNAYGSAQMDTLSSKMERFKFSNFGGYTFNQHWKLEGGLFFTTQPQTGEIKTSFSSPFYSTGYQQTYSKGTVKYMSGHVALVMSPSASLSNRLNAEASQVRDQMNTEKISGNIYSTGQSKERYTAYSFSDHFSWQGKLSSTDHLNFSFFAQYRRLQSFERSDTSYSYTNGAFPGRFGWSVSNDRGRSLILSPTVQLSLKNVLFAEAGVCYDTYGISDFGPNQHKKLLPNAGLKMELSSLIHPSLISSLEVCGNFSKYITDMAPYDPLGNRHPVIAPVFTPGQQFFPNPSLYGYYPPVANWLASVQIGVDHDRFILKAQYRKHEKQIFSLVPTFNYPGNPTIYVPISETLTAKGLCFELKTAIIQKENKSWDVYATMFHDQYSRKYVNYPPTPIESILLDAGKAPWRGGLRTSVVIRRFFAQASAMINFDELSIDKEGNVKEDMERFFCDYLLAGYSIPVKGFIKKLEANVQSTGLLHVNTYALSKYIGIGVKVGL